MSCFSPVPTLICLVLTLILDTSSLLNNRQFALISYESEVLSNSEQGLHVPAVIKHDTLLYLHDVRVALATSNWNKEIH